MTEKRIMGRAVQKHDIETNWLKATNFTPMQGEIIVYDIDENYDYERFKIGDGESNVNDLPFAGGGQVIIDVVELPIPNDTAQFCANREIAPPDSGYVCHVVNTLPEIGEVVSDTDISFITAYYSKTDNEAYGYVDNALGSAFSVPAGWYTLQQLFSKVDIPYGGIIHNIYEDQMNSFYLLVTLSTGEVDEHATYRLLKGTFIHNKMLQNHCVCHTVEWENGPVGTGTPVLFYNEFGFLTINGYYNITDNTVYGYFDDVTIEGLEYIIDALDLNDLVKLALKAALKTISKGWKTMEEVVSLVGETMSMSWGNIITDITEATDNDTLYLLLSSKYYSYKNNNWITTDNGIGMPGQFTGAEIFNDPHNIATGKASHAEGLETAAENDASHAEGYRTQATGKMSHAEGEETIANGQDAHAEGYKTQAVGQASHAEGTSTRAYGAHAHVEGYETEAHGSASHAGGIRTEALGEAQTVIGRHNTVDSSKAFIIGNGNDLTKSNAMSVDWYGNAEFEGTVTANGEALATETYVDDKVAKIDLTNYATKSDVGSAFSTKYIRTGWDGITYVNNQYRPIGDYATIEGHNNRAFGYAAHAEGEKTWANGAFAHAEGYDTKAITDFTHVEGVSSTASGQVAHAEGIGTTASGTYSHSQGESAVASGHASHAEGKGTIAAGTVQHVQGMFNVEDANSNYLHIVGNGSDDTNRSNAHTIDWSGNAWFKGDIKVGGTGQDDENAKTLATTAYVDSLIGTGVDAITNDEIDEICSLTLNTYLDTIAAEEVSF